MSVPLAVIEDIIDASGVAPAIEALLPAGVRGRQLTARTLLTGMLLVLDDRRPAFLTEVRAALIALPETDQARLGVTAEWTTGPHQLTYRQAGHTHRLVSKALGKDSPDGAPSDALQSACDCLLEASIPTAHKNGSSALAADWTDVESWSRPPRHGTTACADPEAAWGHRSSNLPGPKGEMFFGYFLSAVVMTREEHGPPVPELAAANRVLLPSGPGPRAGPVDRDARVSPARRHHRRLGCPPRPRAWATRSGEWRQPIQDLHPHDRGPGERTRARSSPTATSTARRHPHRCCSSARCHPARPPSRQPRTTTRPPNSPLQTRKAHRRRRRRLPPRHLPGRGQSPLPAPPRLVPLSRDRPEILTPPPHRPPAAPSRPSPPDHRSRPRPGRNTTTHRRNGGVHRRRTAAERVNATIKDTATTSIAHGWCRLTGLAPLTLWIACLLAARNQRILTAWDARQQDDARRAAAGLPPRTRKRRRTSLAQLAAGP